MDIISYGWLTCSQRQLRGHYIKNKEPSTITRALIESWIVGDGFGPGHPTCSFYSDNGGEFLNSEVIDFAASLDTSIRMTSSHAPWQNGAVERHHATCDIIISKLLEENPHMNIQEAINKAALAKNSEINQSGFSALQLVMGQNPSFPGLSEANPGSSNLDNSSKAMKALREINETRVMFRELDCSERLRKVKGQRINPAVERFYSMGDPVLFRDAKKKKWVPGTALVRFGKTLYLKHGNWLRRVPVDMVIPDTLSFEKRAEAQFEGDSFVEEKVDNFEEDETSVAELSRDLESAHEIRNLKEEVSDLKSKLEHYEENKGDSTTVHDLIDKEELQKHKRKLRRERKKAVKAPVRKMPTLGQHILFREKCSDEWIRGKVFGVFKKTSKHKNIKQIELENGRSVEKDFENDIADWIPVVDEEDEQLDNAEVIDSDAFYCHETYPVQQVNRKEYGSPEVQEAMEKEIQKFKSFNAYTEVEDVGQTSVPVRWVVTRHAVDGKNQPLKARLCIRGDLEPGKNSLRSDSPTAGKDSLKIALAIAANEGFNVKNVDIKSAYLQGKDLDREKYVRPPPEANIVGKLWLLNKAAYGVLDGGRLFYLRLADELLKLGLHKVHSDGALFTFVKNGRLHGLVASHVDDLLMAGDATFEEEVEHKLAEIFQFSKVETGNFKYCGCSILAENGSIQVQQHDYVDNLKYIPVDYSIGQTDRLLTSAEMKVLRARVGEVLWLSLITRPDLSFDINKLSAEIPNARVKTLIDMNRIIKKAKNKKQVITFSRLGKIEEIVVRVYTDASYNNQDDQVRSTAGKVILLEHPESEKGCAISWKTKKIQRVCRSVKSAETRALDEGLDEAVHVARIVKEIYNGKIDLKQPDQLPVLAKTDSKSVWENLNNTRQCEEKILRNTIAGIKELLELGVVRQVDWVPTNLQLADCLTKTCLPVKSERLLDVISTNHLSLNRV